MWTECVQQSVITINFDQQWTYHQHLRNVFLLIRSFTHQWGLFKLFAKHFKCCRIENIRKNIPFHTFYSHVKTSIFCLDPTCKIFYLNRPGQQSESSPGITLIILWEGHCLALLLTIVSSYVSIMNYYYYIKQVEWTNISCTLQSLTIFWFINFEITSKQWIIRYIGTAQWESELMLGSPQNEHFISLFGKTLFWQFLKKKKHQKYLLFPNLLETHLTFIFNIF